MRYIAVLVSVLILGCAQRDPAKSPLRSVIQTSAGSVSGFIRGGGLKEYMGIRLLFERCFQINEIGALV